jgi:hypothetical protein
MTNIEVVLFFHTLIQGNLTKVWMDTKIIIKIDQWCFIKTSLCRMNSLVIIIATILKSFWIIICHRSNSILKLYIFWYVCILLFVLHTFNVFVCLYFVVWFTSFQCYFYFVYLYLVVNFSNESNFHWHFA